MAYLSGQGVDLLGEVGRLVHHVNEDGSVLCIGLLESHVHTVGIWGVLDGRGLVVKRSKNVSCLTYIVVVEGDLAGLNHVGQCRRIS